MVYTWVMNGEASPEIQALRNVHFLHGCSDEELGKILEQAEPVSFSNGDFIFKAGETARGFYILVSGKVRLTRKHGKSTETLLMLEGNGYFGQEALNRREKRQVNAEALSDGTALKFSMTALDFLLDEITGLLEDLDLVRETYRLFLHEKTPWRGVREAVHLMIRRHPIFLWQRLIPAIFFAIFTGTLFGSLQVKAGTQSGAFLVLVGISLAVTAIWAALAWIDWSNDYSIVTSRRVAFHERIILIYDSRREVPLEAVLSDDQETSLLGRMLSFGNVVVRTYTGMLHLPDIPHPEAVRRLLSHVQDTAREQSKIKQQETMDNVIRQRFKHEEIPTAAGEQEVVPVYQHGTLQTMLVNLFQMRMVQGPSIIYRTHWFILFARLFLPTLINLILFILFLLRLFGVMTFLQLGNFVAVWLILEFIAISWWVYQYVDWSNDRYIITDRELIDYYRKPLGREERRSAPLENIQTIDYEQRNLIALIFNYGTVYIRIGDSELSFNNFFNPSEVQRQIFERYMEKKKKREEDLARAEQERMLGWLDSYDRIIHPQQAFGDEEMDAEEEEEENPQTDE